VVRVWFGDALVGAMVLVLSQVYQGSLVGPLAHRAAWRVVSSVLHPTWCTTWDGKI
jgi:hypothetical protein